MISKRLFKSFLDLNRYSVFTNGIGRVNFTNNFLSIRNYTTETPKTTNQSHIFSINPKIISAPDFQYNEEFYLKMEGLLESALHLQNTAKLQEAKLEIAKAFKYLETGNHYSFYNEMKHRLKEIELGISLFALEDCGQLLNQMIESSPNDFLYKLAKIPHAMKSPILEERKKVVDIILELCKVDIRRMVYQHFDMLHHNFYEISLNTELCDLVLNFVRKEVIESPNELAPHLILSTFLIPGRILITGPDFKIDPGMEIHSKFIIDTYFNTPDSQKAARFERYGSIWGESSSIMPMAFKTYLFSLILPSDNGEKLLKGLKDYGEYFLADDTLYRAIQNRTEIYVIGLNPKEDQITLDLINGYLEILDKNNIPYPRKISEIKADYLFSLGRVAEASELTEGNSSISKSQATEKNDLFQMINDLQKGKEFLFLIPVLPSAGSQTNKSILIHLKKELGKLSIRSKSFKANPHKTKFYKLLVNFVNGLLTQYENDVLTGVVKETDDVLFDMASHSILNTFFKIENSVVPKFTEMYSVYEAHKYEESLKMGLELLEMVDRNEEVENHIAYCYYMLADFPNTYKYLNPSLQRLMKTPKIKDDPKLVRYLLGLSDVGIPVFYYSNAFDDFKKLCEMVISLEEGEVTNPIVYEYLGIYYYGTEVDMSKSKQCLLKAIEINPRQSASPYYYLGEIARINGNYDKSIFYANKVNEVLEENLKERMVEKREPMEVLKLAEYTKAFTEFQRNNYEASKIILEGILEKYGDDGIAFSKLAEIANMSDQQPEKALSLSKKAIKLLEVNDSKSAYLLDSFYSYGNALNSLGKYKESYLMFTSTIKLLYDGYDKEEVIRRPNLFYMTFLSGVNHCITEYNEVYKHALMFSSSLDTYEIQGFISNVNEEASFDESNQNLLFLLKLLKSIIPEESIDEENRAINSKFLNILTDSIQNGILSIGIFKTYGDSEPSIIDSKKDIGALVLSTCELIGNIFTPDR